MLKSLIWDEGYIIFTNSLFGNRQFMSLTQRRTPAYPKIKQQTSEWLDKNDKDLLQGLFFFFQIKLLYRGLFYCDRENIEENQKMEKVQRIQLF